MFGFLRPTTWNCEYRRAYARCCQFQHLRFGVRSLPFLSYEGVLLYQLATDAGLISGPPAGTRTCCRLQTDRASLEAEDAEVGRYCAAVGLLLAGIKLDDDVRDEGSWLARGVRWSLRKPLAQTRELFRSLDSDFDARVDEFITAHLRLETSGRSIGLDRYARPTAEAFGYVFELLPISFSGNGKQQEIFRDVGRHVGAAIIAYDCAVDWSRDRAKGRYNPLADITETDEALTHSAVELAQALGRCSGQFGEHSRSGWLLRSAFDRIPRQIPQLTWKSRLRNWGLARDPNYVTARIDCCDCGGIECCADGIGGADCCIVGGDHSCFCAGDCCSACPEILCCLDDRQGGKRRARTKIDIDAESPAESSPLLGQTGSVESPLRPWGTVLIDGERHPAHTEMQWIDAGSEVKVVAQTAQGLIVRPLNE